MSNTQVNYYKLCAKYNKPNNLCAKKVRQKLIATNYIHKLSHKLTWRKLDIKLCAESYTCEES